METKSAEERSTVNCDWIFDTSGTDYDDHSVMELNDMETRCGGRDVCSVHQLDKDEADLSRANGGSVSTHPARRDGWKSRGDFSSNEKACLIAGSQSEVSVDADIMEVIVPDGGWGWAVCFGSFMVNFILDGTMFSFGVLLLYLLEEFGMDKATTSWVGSAQMGVHMCMGPLISALLSRYSLRQVTIAGSLLASVSFIVSVFAPNIYVLILTYGVIAGVGFGMAFLPAIISVGLYFSTKRAIATGIATSGSGLGTFSFAYLTNWLVVEYGWRGTVLILSAVLLNCCVSGMVFRPLLYRRASRPAKQSEDPTASPRSLPADKSSASSGYCSDIQPVHTTLNTNHNHLTHDADDAYHPTTGVDNRPTLNSKDFTQDTPCPDSAHLQTNREHIFDNNDLTHTTLPTSNDVLSTTDCLKRKDPTPHTLSTKNASLPTTVGRHTKTQDMKNPIPPKGDNKVPIITVESDAEVSRNQTLGETSSKRELASASFPKQTFLNNELYERKAPSRDASADNFRLRTGSGSLFRAMIAQRHPSVVNSRGKGEWGCSQPSSQLVDITKEKDALGSRQSIGSNHHGSHPTINHHHVNHSGNHQMNLIHKNRDRQHEYHGSHPNINRYHANHSGNHRTSLIVRKGDSQGQYHGSHPNINHHHVNHCENHCGNHCGNHCANHCGNHQTSLIHRKGDSQGQYHGSHPNITHHHNHHQTTQIPQSENTRKHHHPKIHHHQCTARHGAHTRLHQSHHNVSSIPPHGRPEFEPRLFQSMDHLYSPRHPEDAGTLSTCGCQWQADAAISHHVSRGLLRPLLRKDIYYSGSVSHLPEYQDCGGHLPIFVAAMTRDSFSQSASEDGQKDVLEDCTAASRKWLGKVWPGSLMKNRTFLLLLVTFTMWTAQSVSLNYVPDLAVSKGISKSDAAFLISIVGFANVLGRLLAGFINDCISLPSVWLYVIALLSGSVVNLMFPFCESYLLLQICSASFGLCMAVAVSLRTIVLAEQLGIEMLTESFGIVAMFQGIAFTINPPIAGKLIDDMQSFVPPFIMASLMYAISGLSALAVGVTGCRKGRSLSSPRDTPAAIFVDACCEEDNVHGETCSLCSGLEK